MFVVCVCLVAVSLVVASFLVNLFGGSKQNRFFTYPLCVGDKSFVVVLETNWSEERVPSVVLLDPSVNLYPIELYFLGGAEDKTVFYNISFPADLVWGNISLMRKYYLVNPDNYVLSSNGTHTSLQMTFDYKPFFSGIGYFTISGTKGAW